MGARRVKPTCPDPRAKDDIPLTVEPEVVASWVVRPVAGPIVATIDPPVPATRGRRMAAGGASALFGVAA